VSLCRFLNEAVANYIVIPFANPQLLWKTKQTTARRTRSTGRFLRNY